MHTIANQSRNKKDPLRISIKILEIALSKISHWHCSWNEASGISIHSSIFTSIKIQHWTTRTDYPPLTKEKERWLKTWYQNTYERNVQTYVVVSITQICCTNANTHFKTSPLRWITNILLFNPLHVRYVQVVMGRPYSIFRNWNKKNQMILRSLPWSLLGMDSKCMNLKIGLSFLYGLLMTILTVH